jgi:hypothetical protein
VMMMCIVDRWPYGLIYKNPKNGQKYVNSCLHWLWIFRMGLCVITFD